MMRFSDERAKSALCERVRTGARAGVTLLVLLASTSLALPAKGQGAGTSCVNEDLACSAGAADAGSGNCSRFQSCFVTATESIYYTASGRRFDCDGLECEQAQRELNAFCCPIEESDAGTGGRRVNHSDGCTLSLPPRAETARTESSNGQASLGVAGLALLSLLTLRRRAAARRG
jgi:hypothetical protein